MQIPLHIKLIQDFYLLRLLFYYYQTCQSALCEKILVFHMSIYMRSIKSNISSDIIVGNIQIMSFTFDIASIDWNSNNRNSSDYNASGIDGGDG